MRKFLALTFIIVIFFQAWMNRLILERLAFEKTVNHFSKEVFRETFRAESAYLSRDFHFHASEIRGTLQLPGGKVPFMMESLESETAVTDALKTSGVWFTFKNLRLQPDGGSISGRILYTPKKEWYLTGIANVSNLDLRELRWMNPENLKGASGPLNGNVNFQLNTSGAQFFHFNLRVKEPGGKLPSQLFSSLTPYIPAAPHKAALRQLSEEGTVGFKTASLQTDLTDPQKMKVVLQILIPEYNLNLNLNLEVRIDQKHAFSQLIQVMGLIKIS